MILQTQIRSSSEKGYIADNRPRNFDAGISAAFPCKTNNIVSLARVVQWVAGTTHYGV